MHLLGVSDHSKAYKLYNPRSKKIVVSRDKNFGIKVKMILNKIYMLILKMVNNHMKNLKKK
ncbi:hypothetical protein CR513_55408, partial [Mucuna pruriens]